MKKILKRIFVHLALILGGLIVALLLLELLLRLAGAKPQTYLRKFSQYHPVMGWVKTPNAEGEFIKGTKKIYQKFNSRGLRDIEYDYSKPDSTFRILIIGDSFTEGYDVEFNELFTEILEQQLNDTLSHHALHAEVINAGTGGYSTDQEYLYYLTEGYKYSSDVVIVMMYMTNDVYYNTKAHYGNYPKPLFAIRNDSLITINLPLPKPKQQESVKNIFRNMALYPIVTRLIYSYMPSVRDWLASMGLISASTMEQLTFRKDQTPNTPAFPPSFKVYNRQDDDEMISAWNITERILRDWRDTCNNQNTHLILFSIPDKFQIYPHLWEITQKVYHVNDTIWNPDKPDQWLKTIADRYQIPALFLKDYLAEMQIKDYLYGGVHWNAKGHRVVADYIFRELIKGKYIGFEKTHTHRN